MTIKQILLFKLHQSYQQQLITCFASENRTRDETYGYRPSSLRYLYCVSSQTEFTSELVH